MEWFEPNIPYLSMRLSKHHYHEHLEVDMEIGDLVTWTHRGTLSIAVHLGVVVEVVGPSIKVCWEDSNEHSWMNEAWLEKL
mgnify:CR=1 FL=1